MYDWAYELAAHLGYYNVDAMLASAPAGQLRMWRLHYEKKPFGSNWHQYSMIVATLINFIRQELAPFKGEKLKQRDYLKTDAFVPKFGKQKARGPAGVVRGAKALRSVFKMMCRLP